MKYLDVSATSRLVKLVTEKLIKKIVCRAHEKINLTRNLSRKNCSSARGLKRDIVIPKGRPLGYLVGQIQGSVTTTMPVLFEPDEQSRWPSSLIFQETLTTIKRGKSTILEIPVFNNTQHDIMANGQC